MKNTFEEPQKVFYFHDVGKDEVLEINAWTEKGAWNCLMYVQNYKEKFRLLTMSDAEKPGSPNLS